MYSEVAIGCVDRDRWRRNKDGTSFTSSGVTFVGGNLRQVGRRVSVDQDVSKTGRMLKN